MFEEELAECHFKDGAGPGPMLRGSGREAGRVAWDRLGKVLNDLSHRKAQGAEAEQMFSLGET